MDNGILAGIRVVDCGTYIAGPAAAVVMSDFGADVIKIDRPPSGDPYRYLSLAPGMPVSPLFYCWILDGRNKRSVALNFRARHEIIVPVSWGGQSWLPPAFRPAFGRRNTCSSRLKRRLQGKIACPTLFYNRLVLEQLFRDTYLVTTARARRCSPSFGRPTYSSRIIKGLCSINSGCATKTWSSTTRA